MKFLISGFILFSIAGSAWPRGIEMAPATEETIRNIQSADVFTLAPADRWPSIENEEVDSSWSQARQEAWFRKRNRKLINYYHQHRRYPIGLTKKQIAALQEILLNSRNYLKGPFDLMVSEECAVETVENGERVLIIIYDCEFNILRGSSADDITLNGGGDRKLARWIKSIPGFTNLI